MNADPLRRATSRRHLSLVLTALLLLAVTAVGRCAEESLVPNGSMTEGAALPAGWDEPKTETGPGRVTAARDTTVFKAGPASLRLATEGGEATGAITRQVPELAGKDLAVTGWARAEGKVISTLAFICPDAEPAWNPIQGIGPSAGWRRINARIKLPVGTKPVLLLNIQGEGRVWLDELAILPGDRFQPDAVITEFQAAPLFSFLGWEKKPVAGEGGTVVQAPNCQGGAGWALREDLSSFAERTPALTVTIGPANKARSLLFSLGDADGTVHQYTFKLEGIAAGATATITADDGASLKEPNKLGDAGKTPGFDMAQIAQVIVIGGTWTPDQVDLTLKRLELVEPDAKILQAREGLRLRLAREAEARRKAEEERERRKRELLAHAPHPADGPDIRHVGLVAPDVLALSIQEKEFAWSPQVPYEPQPGDEIRHVGKDPLWVIEGGKVQQAPLDVVVVRKVGGQEQTLGHLAINAGRLKPEDKATGQDLTVETVEEPAAYRIVGVDDPAWTEAAAPAQVWWKRKPNAYSSRAFDVEVFLKLPKPLAAGKSYRVEVVGINTRQDSVVYRNEPAKTRSPAVHVTGIGFRPDDPFKRAFLSQWLGTGGPQHYGDGARFQLLDDATGKAVFSGTAQKLKGADDKESFKAGRNYSKTDVLALDFGAFRTPGRYRVYVEGVGCSYPFRIGADVWEQAFRVSMMGLLHERSGIALGPPFTTYVRPRNMHPADGVKVFASAGSEMESGGQDGAFKMLGERRTDKLLPDAWGGHADAGDWDRNSAHPAAMWMLVDLYELFPAKVGAIKLNLPPAEAKNNIPDVLDEVLWNLELYRRLQASDVFAGAAPANGGVGAGIESTSHPRPGEASWQESLVLSAYAPDPRASFIYAGTAAKLSRALARFDKARADAYALSAREAWTWAKAHTDEYVGRLPEASRAGMADNLRDVRNLASFELWRLTKEPAFHDDFRATTLLPDGEMHRQLKAVLSYSRLPDGQGDPELRKAARAFVVQAADTALAFADDNAFGITSSIPGLPPIGFVGYLSTPETIIGPLLPQAWLQTHDRKYLAGAVRACQFAAGANPDNRALTTGLGPDPIRYPLFIDSQITGQPAPAGITVYGVSDPAENYGFDNWAYTWYLQKMVPAARTWPAHESYWDISIVPSSNEFTIHQSIIPTAYYWGFLAARE